MTVITGDNRLKREVQRVTAATASTADFGPDLTVLDGTRHPNLVIVDARKKPPGGLAAKLPPECAVIYIVGDQNITDDLPLFGDARVVSVMSHGARFDADEFIASATKALRRNVFGLNKYFPWGVTTYSVVVKNYIEKNKAIDLILHYAVLAGIRGPVRDRIQVVADELMMNALYHAPVDAEGRELYRDRSVKELAQLSEVPAIEIQYGSSGRFFGLSVRDGGGSLSRERAMQYLLKARSSSPAMDEKVGGAGLGLVSVMRSVSKLVFNLDPGHSTEVVALFDVELFAKGQVGARSIHVFKTGGGGDEAEAEVDAAAAAAAARPPPAQVRRGPWILAAVLLAVVASLATAVAMKKTRSNDASCPPTSGTVGPVSDGRAPAPTPR